MGSVVAVEPLGGGTSAVPFSFVAMNIRFDEVETEALRQQASAEHRSMQEVARAAVREYIARRAHESAVRESAERNAERYREVLHRLGTL